MVWHPGMAVLARADASIPDITDPWPAKDVSSCSLGHDGLPAEGN